MKVFLPISESTIDRLGFDFALSIDTAAGLFRIGSPIDISIEAQESKRFVPEKPASDSSVLLPLVSLLHEEISSATYDERGRLEIRLGRTLLSVGPDQDYEAWSFTAADGRLWVAQPGGEVGSWKAPTKP